MGKETYKQRQNKHKVTRPLFNAFDSFCSKMMQKDVCFTYSWTGLDGWVVSIQVLQLRN